MKFKIFFFPFFIASCISLFTVDQFTFADETQKDNESSVILEDQFQDENPKVKSLLQKELPKIETANIKERNEAIFRLGSNLLTLGNSRIYPNQKSREIYSKKLIQLYKQLPDTEVDAKKVKAAIIRIVGLHGDSNHAKKFLLNLLEHGDSEQKAVVLKSLASPKGVYGDDVYQKILDLCRKGVIPEELKAYSLWATGRDKGLPEVLNIIDTTKQKEIFVQSSRVLQYYDKPEHLSHVFRRIKDLKLNVPEGNDEQPNFRWLNKKQLGKFIEQSKDDDLVLGLEVANMDHRLIDSETVPVLMQKLKSPHRGARKLSAGLLSVASNRDKRANRKEILDALEASGRTEADPSVKEEINRAKDFIKKNEKK